VKGIAQKRGSGRWQIQVYAAKQVTTGRLSGFAVSWLRRPGRAWRRCSGRCCCRRPVVGVAQPVKAGAAFTAAAAAAGAVVVVAGAPVVVVVVVADPPTETSNVHLVALVLPVQLNRHTEWS